MFEANGAGGRTKKSWTTVRTLVAVMLFVAVAAVSGCGDDDCDLRIETELLPSGIAGVPYEFELQSDCGGFWFLSQGNLPPGISFEVDGDLVGTPTVAGEYQFTIGLEDFFTGLVVFKGFSLTIEEP